MKKMVLVLVFFVGLIPCVQAGEVLDAHFGQDGKVITSIKQPFEDRGEVVTHDAKGRIYVAGNAGLPDEMDFFIARYLPDGKLDPSFGHEGVVIKDVGGKDHVHGLALGDKGQIYVVGYSVYENKSVFAIVAVNEQGVINRSFGQDGVVKTVFQGQAYAHFAVFEGKQLVVAGFVESNGDTDFAIARYNSDGTLDVPFGDGGKAVIDWTQKDRIYGLSVSGGNQPVYYLTGSALNAATGEDCIVLALNKQGQRIKEFGFGGLARVGFGEFQDVCSSVLVDKKGQVLVAGYVNDKKGANPDYAVARLNKNGTLDSSFGNNGITQIDFDGGIDVIHGLGFLSNGDIVVGGESEIKTSQGYKFQFSLARLNVQGKPVTSWANKGLYSASFDSDVPEQSMGLTVDKQDRVILAGYASRNVALMRVLTKAIKEKKK